MAACILDHRDCGQTNNVETGLPCLDKVILLQGGGAVDGSSSTTGGREAEEFKMAPKMQHCARHLIASALQGLGRSSECSTFKVSAWAALRRDNHPQSPDQLRC